MKKTIKTFAAVIICAFFFMLVSCYEDAVDKKIDEIDNMYSRMEKLLKEDRPTREELVNFKVDLIKLQQSMLSPDMKDSELTEKQRKRLLNIMNKAQGLPFDPNFERLQRLAIQYDLNY